MYENQITEPDKHTLDCERRAGFEAGRAMQGRCKMERLPLSESYLCKSCGMIIHLRGLTPKQVGYKFCPGCGAKIMEVEK